MFNSRLKRVLLCIGLALLCLFNTACSPKVPPGNIGDEVIISEGDLIAEIEIEGYGVMKFKLFPDIAPQAVDNFVKLSEKGYYNGLKIHRVLKDGFIQGGSLNGDGTGGDAVINTNGFFPTETSPDARHFFGALCMANLNGNNTTQFYVVNSRRVYDLRTYDVSKIKEAAAEFAAAREGLDEYDPRKDEYTYNEARYLELANMIEKASDTVIKKYFETTGGCPDMDGSNTVFGQLFEGKDVLEAITGVAVTSNNLGELSRPIDDLIITAVRVTEAPPAEPEEETSSSSKKK